MDDQPEFAAFLHNPWAFPTKKQEAAILCFKRKQRFVEGYDINQHLSSFLNIFFGDLNVLYKDGLQKHYSLLKEKVISNNLIGLILYGTNIDDPYNKVLNVYETANGSYLTLNIKNICIYLIKDYIKKENVDDLCVKSPNFHIYYKE